MNIELYGHTQSEIDLLLERAEESERERDFFYDKLDVATNTILDILVGTGRNEIPEWLRMKLGQIIFDADEAKFNAAWTVHKEKL
jgi:hypothetical protein